MRRQLPWLCAALIVLSFACDGGTKNKVKDDAAIGDDDILLGDSDDLLTPDADFSLTCDNGTIDGGEPCDGNTELCTTIDPTLYSGGKAKCKEDCSGYDTATCDEKQPECGNNIIEQGEICDGGTKNCVSLSVDFIGGTAFCRNDCSGWDTSTCITAAMCGNDTLDNGETCDKGANSTTKVKNCVEIDPYSFSGGKAKCNATCDGWDTSTCDEIAPDQDTVDNDIVVDDGVPDIDTACTNDCLVPNQERCFNETAQKCQQGWDGCYHWSNLDICYQKNPPQTCQFDGTDAYCVASCTSDCTADDRRCNPTYPDQVDLCAQGRDGCYHWTYYEDCSYWGMICVDPGLAGCEYPDTSQTDTIGTNSASYTGGDRLKGNYFSCTTTRSLTEIQTYMAFRGGLNITYALYYSSTQNGTYSLGYQQTVNHYSSSGAPGWYSSGDIYWGLTSGNYYFIGVYFGTTDNASYPDPTYYYSTSLTTTPLAFGTHLGGGESSTYASLPNSITTIDNQYGYYMQITTE